MNNWSHKLIAITIAITLHAALFLALPEQTKRLKGRQTHHIAYYQLKKAQPEPLKQPEVSKLSAEVKEQPASKRQINRRPKPAKQPLLPPAPRQAGQPVTAEPLPAAQQPPPVLEEKPQMVAAATDKTVPAAAAPALLPGNCDAAAPATPIGGRQPGFRTISAKSLKRLPVPDGRCNVSFPPEAEELGFEGDVILSLDIDENGLVKTVKLLKGIYPILDKAAIRGIKTCHFTPATVGGEKVAVSGLTYRYSFVLD